MLHWIASRAGRFGRPGIAAIVGIALALTAAACARTVTHESDGFSYAGFDEAGGATYAVIPASEAAIPAYRGDAIARVDTPGDVAVGERGLGIVDVDPDVPYRYEGWYAAAFYFPEGSFTGGTPSQRGALDIMRWTGTTGQSGGLRIDRNHQ